MSTTPVFMGFSRIVGYSGACGITNDKVARCSILVAFVGRPRAVIDGGMTLSPDSGS